MTQEEIHAVEKLVNAKIRSNIPRQVAQVPIDKAKEAGAMMLFGEKYGDVVRMITFDPAYSVELCGGCHVTSTGQIGVLKITSESAIAAGVRRIEAVTGEAAEMFIDEKLQQLDEISTILKHPADVVSGIGHLVEENKQLRKQLEEVQQQQVAILEKELRTGVEHIASVACISQRVALTDTKALKDLVFRLTTHLPNAVVLLGTHDDGKVQLHLGISKPLVDTGAFNASKMIRELAKHVKGGGGGQPFYASAGGSDPAGLDNALKDIKAMIGDAVRLVK
jgi:alanyl-tRNA synthetase